MTELSSCVLDATLPYVQHQLQNCDRNAVGYKPLAMKQSTVYSKCNQYSFILK